MPGKLKDDRRHNAEGLTNSSFHRSRARRPPGVALHHHRDATGDFDILDGAAHLGFGFGGFAVFLGDQSTMSSM